MHIDTTYLFSKANPCYILVNKQARGPGPGPSKKCGGPVQKVRGAGPWAHGPSTFCWALGPGRGPLTFLLTRM